MSAPTVWRTLISEQVNSLCCWNLGEADFHGAATVQRGFERLFESSAEYIETVILIFFTEFRSNQLQGEETQHGPRESMGGAQLYREADRRGLKLILLPFPLNS
jgi:hypothetical protein